MQKDFTSIRYKIFKIHFVETRTNFWFPSCMWTCLQMSLQTRSIELLDRKELRARTRNARQVALNPVIL